MGRGGVDREEYWVSWPWDERETTIEGRGSLFLHTGPVKEGERDYGVGALLYLKYQYPLSHKRERKQQQP